VVSFIGLSHNALNTASNGWGRYMPFFERLSALAIAVSPYVMAIGGTTLSTTNGNTWAGETVWSCSSPTSCQQTSSGGAGGGPSLTENARERALLLGRATSCAAAPGSASPGLRPPVTES